MSGDALGSPDDRGSRRGLKFRRRDDHAINLFREAEAHLADIPRVNRILLELGRLYDPVVGGSLVDLPLRRRVVDLLSEGRLEEAKALLDARLTAYTEFDRSFGDGE